MEWGVVSVGLWGEEHSGGPLCQNQLCSPLHGAPRAELTSGSAGPTCVPRPRPFSSLSQPLRAGRTHRQGPGLCPPGLPLGLPASPRASIPRAQPHLRAPMPGSLQSDCPGDPGLGPTHTQAPPPPALTPFPAAWHTAASSSKPGHRLQPLTLGCTPEVVQLYPPGPRPPLTSDHSWGLLTPWTWTLPLDSKPPSLPAAPPLDPGTPLPPPAHPT